MNAETNSIEANAVGEPVVGELPTTPPPSAPVSGSPFWCCLLCHCREECEGMRCCVNAVMEQADRERRAYVKAGVCSGCGARSMEEAEHLCRPQSVGDTGDYDCPGEGLWQDEDEENTQAKP